MEGEWGTKPLGELTENFDGKRVPVKELDRRPGPYPYYGASGVVDHVDAYLFDGEYLLIAEDGENLRTRQTPVAFMASGKFWVNNHAHIVRGNHLADTRFLSYALSQTDLSGYLTGSTMPKLTQGNLNRIPIVAPPLAEQKAIAAVLGALDDKIELNRRMNATLEAMARALFQSWFVDFDPVRAKIEGHQPPGMDKATAALFPDSFQDSDIGHIPKGWAKTTIGREADFFTGFAFQSEQFSSAPHSIRLARGDNVKEGFFHWDSKTRYWPKVSPELERYQLRCGDVLIGMDGSKVGKNWVRVRNSDLPCLLVQRVARLRAAQSVGEHFLWLLLSDSRFRFHVEAVKTGTSIPHISGGQIKAYDFVRPPLGDNRLFRRFEELVRPLGEQMDANIDQSRTLATLRDTLLPRLLSGELSVPVGGADRKTKT